MNLLHFFSRSSWRVLSLVMLAGCISGLGGAGLIALINTALSAEAPAAVLLA